MKLLTAFLLLIAFAASGQNPYSSNAYDSLVIYDYGQMVGKGNIKKTGKYYSFFDAPKKHIKLSKTEAKEFSDKTGANSSYGDIKDDCFDPHFAALYYKGGYAVGYVEVCTECNVLQASFNLPWPGTGMMPVLLKYLKGLMVEYNFSHLPKVK